MTLRQELRLPTIEHHPKRQFSVSFHKMRNVKARKRHPILHLGSFHYGPKAHTPPSTAPLSPALLSRPLRAKYITENAAASSADTPAAEEDESESTLTAQSISIYGNAPFSRTKRSAPTGISVVRNLILRKIPVF
jgi:hypothetical protein